ncbi:MAG: protein kinase [Planctomycetia bacterium]|nr:protein kinase [Planctomycetia bacterium]
MRPDDDFSSDSGFSQARTVAKTVDALLDDQSWYWRSGQPVRVEQIVEQHPEIGSDTTGLLDLIYHEILLRTRREERPTLEEYVRRFPHLRAELEKQFEIHRAMHQSRRSPGSPGTPHQSSRFFTGSGDRGQSEAAAVGWQLPGYRLFEPLGRGGMGVVYKARQASLHRLVAVKILRNGALAEPLSLSRFRGEADLLARLEHPNIIRVYDINEHEGTPYYSMELVDGPSLSAYLGGTPVAAAQAAGLVEVVARTMHLVHQRGIVHRDLKPANILLAPLAGMEAASPLARPPLDAFIPKVTDFGLAKDLSSSQTASLSGEIVGTPSYLAPEQAQAAAVTPATDVYALGVILYELLTGRPPLRAETLMATLALVSSQEPVPPRQLNAHVPRDLETVCLKCLEKTPARRYASAALLADDLRRFRNGEPVQARPVGWCERAVKWARRRPTVAALLLVSVLAAVSLAGGVALHIRQEVLEAARQAREEHRVGVVRAEANLLLREGQRALWRDDRPTAQANLTAAQRRLEGEPALADLHAQAVRLNRELQRYQEFLQLFDDAVFHETLFTGLDPTASAAATRQAARQACALFGLDPDTPDAPLPSLADSALDDRQQRAIVERCYQLLLVLSSAAAQPQPGQAPETEDAALAQALAYLDRARRLGPGTRAWHLLRARHLARLGRQPEADEERTRARRVEPADTLDCFLVAFESYRQGQPDQAARECATTLRRQPEHFWAQYLLALCHLQRQRWSEATAALTACAGRRPAFAWCYVLRGYALGELAQTVRAADAEFHFQAAEADFAAALGLNPDENTRYGVLVNRGVTRVRQRRLAEAVADLRAAVALKPAAYQAYANLASALQDQGELEAALTALDRALDRATTARATLYRARAQLQVRRGDSVAALADLDAATGLGGGFAALAQDHYERGRVWQRCQEHARALAAYDNAVQMRPAFAEAQRRRAEVLAELGRFDDAASALDQVIAAGGLGQTGVEVFLARGLARAKAGQLTAAVDDYTQALALRPEAAGHNQRGWLYVALRAPKLALADFDVALRLDRELGDAYAGRGVARAELGQYQPAVSDAEAAVRHAPASPRHLYNVARIYGLVAGKAEGDGNLQRPQSQELVSRSRESGLQFLRQALELAPAAQRAAFWNDFVRTDAALAALRRTLEYQQLAARYEKP